MVALNDGKIRQYINSGYIGCVPEPTDEQYQPGTLDVRIGGNIINMKTGEAINANDTITFEPDTFYLGTTLEYLSIPPDLLPELTGRSSFGREGLMIHVTAGLLDPGFEGTVTLEIKNIGHKPITVNVGERIGQIKFTQMCAPAERPYGTIGHYQHQDGATRSRRNV